MINLVGQKKLLNILNSYTIDTLPKTLLFIGAEGCGKRTFATYLANQLELELVNITDKCSDTDLVYYQEYPLNRIYLIDLRGILEKEQNKFLKFIEEPSDFCNIILVANSEFGILDTILSRCVKFHFAQYTFEEMKEAASFLCPDFNELDYNICKTPGKLIELDTNSINEVSNVCKHIINDKISYGDLMSTFTKINCYENYDQFSFDMFFNLMAYTALNTWKESNSDRALSIYLITQRYLANLQLAPKSSKVDFVTNYLSTIYSEVILGDA